MISAAWSAIARLFTTLLPNSTSSSDNPIQTTNTIQEFVEDTIRDNKTVIFSKSWCPYCHASKAYFGENFQEEAIAVELDQRKDGNKIQKYLKVKTGIHTVPQTFINGHFIGGNSDLHAKDSEDIRRLIAGPHL